MTENQQIAAFILHLTRSATAPTDDQTQENIAVCKRWLIEIQNGNLIVSKAPPLPVPDAIKPQKKGGKK